jgi:hypothetical protein
VTCESSSQNLQTDLQIVQKIALFTSLWRKKLFKVADVVLELPAGKNDCWPMHMHEPLLVGLTLHFI